MVLDNEHLRFGMGKQLQVFEGHTGSIWAVALSPDGKYALSGGDDRDVRVWRLTEK